MDKAEVVKLRDTLKAGMNLPVQVFLDNAYSFVDESNIAQFTIWKHVTKKAKAESEEDEEKMFMKRASFFSYEQVEPIGEKRAV